MPYLDIFCFVCSIRLGSISTGILSIIQVTVPTVFLVTERSDVLKTVAEKLENYFENTDSDTNLFVLLKYSQENARTYFIATVTLSAIHFVACIMEIIGAYILNKWLLLPFIFLDIFRLICSLGLFCITLIAIKTEINLGALIATSVCGTFLLILLGYFWSCVFSLYQVLSVIESPEYQSLYGSDPFSPNETVDRRLNVNDPDNSVKRVKFFPSPDFSDNKNPKPKQRKHDIEIQHAYQPNEFFQTTRTRNDYNEMKKMILKRRQFGTDNNYNRQMNSLL